MRAAPALIGHHGAVYGLARSPFWPKFFASAGDWSVRLWTEDLRTPLLTSPYQPTYLTSVAWSPSRRARLIWLLRMLNAYLGYS
jgi:dynein intermediate chain 2